MPTTPASNYQPSLVLNQSIAFNGIFPPRGGLADGQASYLGLIETYAFNFAQGAFAQGQIIPLAQNTALFSLLGTNYGGNGKSTFALPDLTGRTIIGDGQGPGLSEYFIGEQVGEANFNIHANVDLPPSAGGYSAPIDDMEPSLTMHYFIQEYGVWPTSSYSGFIGEVYQFAGTFAPVGTLECNGQLLSIAEHETLFALLGTTYGGNGEDTFALPDLRGRTVIGTGNGHDLGETSGVESVSLTTGNLPSVYGGTSNPIDNHQPDLALNYLIALQGVFPTTTGVNTGSTPTMGEIVISAGSTIPQGFALCAGQLLPINQNQALFSLLGTQYGGDGRVTFALPDLRGKSVLGSGTGFNIGDKIGTDTITLTAANTPNPIPTANNGTATTNEDNAVSGTVTGSDPLNEAITFVAGTAGHGTIVVNPDGTYTYTPAANYHGTDTFYFAAFDGTSYSSAGAVTVTVNSVNDAPTANASTPSVNEDAVLNSSVSGTDVDGDSLTYAKGTGPSHGSLTFNSNGTYTYTPTANYNGPDSFTFTANDGHVTSGPATVNITVNAVNDAPALTGVKATLAHGTEDTGYIVSKANLLAGFTDIDGDTLSVTGLGADHGSVVDNGNGTYTITPAANYNGAMALSYTVSDGHGGNVSATQSYTVDAVNDSPALTAPQAVLAHGTEDASYTVSAAQLLQGFTDVDGDTLSITGLTANHGTVVNNGNGTFTITPAANYNGTMTLNYSVTDGHGGSAITSSVPVTGTISATESYIIDAVNDAPTGNAPAPAVTNEDQLFFGTVTGSDIDGDTLTFAQGAGPSHGTLDFHSDGTYIYTPSANFNGMDTFTFTASDGLATSGPVIVSITVAPANDAPTANASSETVNEDGVLHGSVSGNDIDGDSLFFAGQASPAHGTLNLNPDGTYTYTPNADFHGTDSFQFTTSDGTAVSGPATVTITVNPVNDAPAQTGTLATLPGGTENTDYIVSAATLLQGFTDVDGDTLTVTGLTTPHGTVHDNGDGTFTITPEAGYLAPMVLSYTVNDGHGGTAAGSNTFLMYPPANTPPVANGSSQATLEDTPLAGAVSGSDADSNPLTFAQGTGPAHGTLDFHSDGSYIYTPDADYHGSDSFTFTANDGTATSGTATVTLNVVAVNDAPTANGAKASTNEDTALNGSVDGSDIDGDSLTFAQGTGPSHGTLAFHADGTYIYTPDADYYGPDSFTFTASDGTNVSGPATVNITVKPVNDAPVANPGNLLLNEDTPLNASVSANDSDGDSLTYAVGTGPSHGTLSLSSDGSFVYTPQANYHGTDSFTFTASDGTAGSAPATVDLTIGAVNDGPTGADDTATVLAGGPRTLNITAPSLLSNDSDIDGDSLTITGVGPAAHGSVSFSNNGTADPTDDTVIYTPTVGYSGPDSFTYTLSDGHGGSTSATVNVTVQAATATTIYTAGGSGDDTIDKSAETVAQLIAGNGGNDTLTGGTANDTLNGGAGNDILHGGKGTDTLTGGTGADQFFIAKGDMASGVDKIVDFEGAGNGDVAGDDKILLEGFNAGATVAQISVAGNAHTYRVTDGGFTGTFIAVYTGSAVLQAGDYIFTPPPAVTYHTPVAGSDLATVLATGPRTISLSVPTLLLNDSDADGDAISIIGVNPAGHGTVVFNNNGTATTADDTITYTPTSGYAGLDTFTYILSDGTTTSNGTVSVTVQAETVSGPTYTSGTAGNDVYNFSAATATQTVAGNGGNDTITTGSAADTINGGAGNDVINGGAGKDTLTGGADQDTFVFTSADADKIVDFSVADDTIALSKATFGALTEQNAVDHILMANQFAIGTAATTVDQHVIYNASTGALWYDADGNGAGAAVQIALLGKNLTLTHDDFVIWA